MSCDRGSDLGSTSIWSCTLCVRVHVQIQDRGLCKLLVLLLLLLLPFLHGGRIIGEERQMERTRHRRSRHRRLLGRQEWRWWREGECSGQGRQGRQAQAGPAISKRVHAACKRVRSSFSGARRAWWCPVLGRRASTVHVHVTCDLLMVTCSMRACLIRLTPKPVTPLQHWGSVPELLRRWCCTAASCLGEGTQRGTALCRPPGRRQRAAAGRGLSSLPHFPTLVSCPQTPPPGHSSPPRALHSGRRVGGLPRPFPRAGRDSAALLTHGRGSHPRRCALRAHVTSGACERYGERLVGRTPRLLAWRERSHAAASTLATCSGHLPRARSQHPVAGPRSEHMAAFEGGARSADPTGPVPPPLRNRKESRRAPCEDLPAIGGTG